MARGTAHEQLSPVCAYVAERTGTSLSVQQVGRLREVLAPHLGKLSEQDYVARLKTAAGASELAELMSAISVHKTDLFRDEVQLAAFSRHVLDPLVKLAGRPLHVWSAGCATGEEVATLLILLAEAGAHPNSTVLGTDIAESALSQARQLAFQQGLLKRVSPSLRERYFRQDGELSSLDPALRAKASFARHNLMDFPYPRPSNGDRGEFDVIFCRNVLIYFTEAAFDQVVTGLAERLRPGGTLVLSAAEPILRPHPLLDTLRCDQAFFYVRRDVRRDSTPRRDLTPMPVQARRDLTPMPVQTRRDLTPMPSQARRDLTPMPVRRDSTPMPVRREQTPMPLGPKPSGREPQAQNSATFRPPASEPTPGPFLIPRPPAPRDEAREPRHAFPELPGVPEEDPRDEAIRTFGEVLEWASLGDSEPKTEAGLRKCLYLDPHFAQARYLLGKLLEQRGQKADAASEYRRALSALNEGRSRQLAFYLNDERLKTACANALRRLGYP
ncbi:MAG TPA: CheR family methyltransferase [Myxococcaceae bacterium]|nr:CheR family methyltransferase [Myxococcaceae bacterium]